MCLKMCWTYVHVCVLLFFIHMYATPNQPSPVLKVIEPCGGDGGSPTLADLSDIVQESWDHHLCSDEQSEVGKNQVSAAGCWAKAPGREVPWPGTTRPSSLSLRVACGSYHHWCLHRKATVLSHPLWKPPVANSGPQLAESFAPLHVHLTKTATNNIMKGIIMMMITIIITTIYLGFRKYRTLIFSCILFTF